MKCDTSKKAENSYGSWGTSFWGISFAYILNSWDLKRQDLEENAWVGRVEQQEQRLEERTVQDAPEEN